MEIKEKTKVTSSVAYHLMGLQSLSCVPGSVDSMLYGLKKVMHLSVPEVLCFRNGAINQVLRVLGIKRCFIKLEV